VELLHTVVELVVDLEKWITRVEEVLSNQPGLTKQSEDLHQQLKQLKVRNAFTICCRGLCLNYLENINNASAIEDHSGYCQTHTALCRTT
jgi:hypothetical protein